MEKNRRRQPPRSIVGLDQEGQLPADEGILAEGADLEAGLDQGGHDLAKAVVPAVLLGGRELR